MKTLELTELRKLDMAKLLEELTGAKKELFKIRFEVRNGQSKSNHLIGSYKKYIAQIKTLIRDENLSIAEESLAK